MTVTVFSKNQCVKCMMTKKYLTNNNIDFKEINIDNEEHLKEYGKTYDEVLNYIKDDLGFRVMPVVVTDNDAWADYQINKLRGLTNG